MKFDYPQSIPVAFDNFPAAIDIRMGELGGDIVPGASLGSKFTLARTPKCGVPQGSYAVGSPIPDYRMVYSDTGSDDEFAIKISFVGWGTFYKRTNADEYLRFQVYKAMVIRTSVAEKIFGDTFECETLIPSTQDITSIFNYAAPVTQFSDPVVSGSDSEGGYVWIGDQKIYIPAGSSIVYTGSSGGAHTVSYVNGAVVIS